MAFGSLRENGPNLAKRGRGRERGEGGRKGEKEGEEEERKREEGKGRRRKKEWPLCQVAFCSLRENAPGLAKRQGEGRGRGEKEGEKVAIV